MKTGQTVRIRPTSPVAGQYQIQPEARGVVLCQYEVLSRGASAATRLDVRLPGGRVIWGVPADAFEEIENEAAALESAN